MKSEENSEKLPESENQSLRKPNVGTVKRERECEKWRNGGKGE